jgi:mono/diheme cytochrome c family protein
MALTTTACNGGGTPDFPPELRSPEAQAEARELGRWLYRDGGCALCHGENADGRGVRRAALSAPPQDFTNPAWRRGTTPGQVFTVIRQGKPGTSMPSWGFLSEADTWNLVAYLLSVSQPEGRPQSAGQGEAR